MSIKSSMGPVGPADALLLVLGSLPGDASLAAQRYYAHPTNQFWRLLGDALGEKLSSMDYRARLECLIARRIALWDVVGEAVRPGSLDGALREVRYNALARFVTEHPHLRAIGFNGKAASAGGRRALGQLSNVRLVDLPSSSAAYTLDFDAKATQWRRLAAFVDAS